MEYNPNCYLCRIRAGKAAAGLRDDPSDMCQPHLEARARVLTAHNKRMTHAIRFALDDDNNWLEVRSVLRAALQPPETPDGQ